MERSESALAKRISTGNFTELKNISDGFHFRCGELNMTTLGFAKVPFSLTFRK